MVKQLVLNLKGVKIHEANAVELKESTHLKQDRFLEEKARGWLEEIDLHELAEKVTVYWNTRMRSVAGKAFFPLCKIELNPLIKSWDGELERTLKHELAHVFAYHQAGRKKIKPHGQEWREACVALGIPGEKACHNLPLPSRRVKRKYVYSCQNCETVIERVRLYSKKVACYSCCRKYNSGRFDSRYLLVVSMLD